MNNPLTGVMDSIKSIVSKATEPERKEPGPGDVGPSYQTRGKGGLVTLPMTKEECGEWWRQVELARTRMKTHEDKMDILLNEYLPIVSRSGEAETVKVQQHFRNVHSKLGNLFYRSPDLVLTANDPSLLNLQMPNPMSKPGMPQLPPLTMEDIVIVKQQVLHKTLGRDGIKTNRLFDELIFDVIAWAGFGASKLGYRCIYQNIPDPQASPNPLMPDPAQAMQPVPIFDEWYWRRFSPKKALWNADLKSVRHDEDATWMGMEFYMSPRAAIKAFKLTPEEASKAASDDRVHLYDDDKQAGGQGLVHGVEIWPKASFFTDQPHPQAINQLVLIEGIRDRPVVWRPSPDQEFDPMGKLTKNSLIGFPIRILTIRDLADSAFPSSDSAFTNSEIKQLSTWRRQSIQLRDAAIGKTLYDTGAFDDDEIKLMKSADVGVWIGVSEGRLKDGADKVVAQTSQPHQTQDDYRNQQLIQNDINETLGINANGAGSYTDTVHSATESANVRSSMEGRNDKEMNRVLDHYLDGARMIDQLLMRYATDEDYIEMTGPDGAKRMQVWNGAMISGKYLYEIAPDSAVRVDTERDFKMAVDHWNLVAKSPLTNQPYLLRRLARQRGLDPSKAVLPPEAVPKPEPEKGKFSMSLNGADLANPLVVKMLIDQGIIKPEDAALNQPVIPEPPEGAADKADVLSQHTASNSGGAPNAPGASNFRDNQAK